MKRKGVQRCNRPRWSETKPPRVGLLGRRGKRARSRSERGKKGLVPLAFVRSASLRPELRPSCALRERREAASDRASGRRDHRHCCASRGLTKAGEERGAARNSKECQEPTACLAEKRKAKDSYQSRSLLRPVRQSEVMVFVEIKREGEQGEGRRRRSQLSTFSCASPSARTPRPLA